MTTAFIGGGNMAEAIISRAVRLPSFSPKSIRVSDPVAEKRAHLLSTYGVQCVESNTEAIENAGLVFLAIKPQHFKNVATALSGLFRNDQTVVSIMAGVTIQNLRLNLNHSKIVRVMPNTPAQVAQGASVWTSTKEVDSSALTEISILLEAIGYQVRVDSEDLIDAATAISGSGPAYIFKLIEVLTEAAEELGIPPEIAKHLVEQTFFGSSFLVKESTVSASSLRQMVTSKGGTTEKALEILDQRGFDSIIKSAAIAAYKKSKELGGNDVLNS